MSSILLGAGIFDRARASLGDSLPRLAGAVVLLVVGLLLAWLLGRLAARALAAVGVDGLGDRFGLHGVIARLGLEPSLSRLIGRVIRITLSVVVVIAALSLLGLGALSQALNEVVLFLPKLLVALALVLLGVVVAELLGDRADRIAGQMDIGAPVGRVVQSVVLALFVLTALAQVGIPTGILMAIVGIVIVASAFTAALAFGLGGRDVARQLSAGRYVGGAFRIGQTISLAGVRGEILAFEPAATVLRTGEGATVRLPNNLLLESVVTVHDEASTAPAASTEPSA